MKQISATPSNRQGKDTEKDYVLKMHRLLYTIPMSRRMAATSVGYPDMTYMVTQAINDWIKQGTAQIIGKIKCSRSGRVVDKISTNPELFETITTNQLSLFQ